MFLPKKLFACSLRCSFMRFALLFFLVMLLFAALHLDNNTRILLFDNGYRLRFGLCRLFGLDGLRSRELLASRKVVVGAVHECDLHATHCRQYVVRERFPRIGKVVQLLLFLWLALVGSQDFKHILLVADCRLTNCTYAIVPLAGGGGERRICARMLLADIVGHCRCAGLCECNILLHLAIGRSVTVDGDALDVDCRIGGVQPFVERCHCRSIVAERRREGRNVEGKMHGNGRCLLCGTSCYVVAYEGVSFARLRE